MLIVLECEAILDFDFHAGKYPGFYCLVLANDYVDEVEIEFHVLEIVNIVAMFAVIAIFVEILIFVEIAIFLEILIYEGILIVIVRVEGNFFFLLENEIVIWNILILFFLQSLYLVLIPCGDPIVHDNLAPNAPDHHN